MSRRNRESGNRKLGRRIFFVSISIFLTLIGISLIIMPFWANVISNPGKLASQELTNNDVGENRIQCKFKTYDEAIYTQVFDSLHWPVSYRFDVDWLIFVGWLVILLAWIFMAERYAVSKEAGGLKPYDNDMGVFALTTLGIQVVALLAGVGLAIFSYYHYDAFNVLAVDLQPTIGKLANQNDLATQFNTQLVKELAETFVLNPLAIFVVGDILLIVLMVILEIIGKYIERHCRTFFDQSYLCLLPNESRLEISAVTPYFYWLPYPHLTYKKSVMDSVSMGESFNDSSAFSEWFDNFASDLRPALNDQLTRYGLADPFVIITPSERVRLVRLRPRVTQTPLPIGTVEVENLSEEFSLDILFNLLNRNGKTTFVEDLKVKLAASFAERFAQTDNNYLANYSQQLSVKLKTAVDGCLSRLTSKRQPNKDFTEATALLHRVTGAKLTAYRQEVSANLASTVEQAIGANFVEPVIDAVKECLLRHSSQSSCRNGGILPEGTRVYLAAGNEELVIIEQKPQLRTIHFAQRFVEDDHNRRRRRVNTGTDLSFNVAFPYFIFVIKINGGNFGSMKAFYRCQPLGIGDDRLYELNLPNICNDSYEVCTGYEQSWPDGWTLAQKIEHLIGHYWQSQFNKDLRILYDRGKLLDPRLANLKTWEKNSQENPLFVLNVPWRGASRISSLTSGFRNDSTEQMLKLVRVAASNCLSQVSDKVQGVVKEYLGNKDLAKAYSSLPTKQLTEHLATLANQLTTAVGKEISKTMIDTTLPDLTAAITTCVEETIGIEMLRLAGETPLRRQINYENLRNSLRNGGQ